MVIMVPVMRQITAFFTHELIVQTAIGYISSTVIWTDVCDFLIGSAILLVRLLLFRRISCVNQTGM